MCSCVAIVSACSPATTGQMEEPALIPAPRQMKWEDNVFRFTARTTIGVDTAQKELLSIAEYLNEKVSTAMGHPLRVGPKGNVCLTLVADTALGNEGYRLNIAPRHVENTGCPACRPLLWRADPAATVAQGNQSNKLAEGGGLDRQVRNGDRPS